MEFIARRYLIRDYSFGKGRFAICQKSEVHAPFSGLIPFSAIFTFMSSSKASVNSNR